MQTFKFDATSTLIDEVAYKFYKENGYVLFANALTVDEVYKINEKVNQLLKAELEASVAHIYGENLQRVWNLVNKDPYFQELITTPQLLSWNNKVFDRKTNHQKFFLSSFQANVLGPGAKAQALHIDTPVPDPLPPWEMKLNTIWILDDYTDTNGATEIIPGSHYR